MSLNLPPLPSKEPKPEVQPSYLYNKETFAAKYKKGEKIYGVPGASLTWGIGGVQGASTEVGKDGEEFTAKVLKEYASQIEGLYVFHSIMLPDGKGDTDHIIVYGDKVIIIDSKRWKSVRKYGISASGHVLRGTVAFPEGKVKTYFAIQKWKQNLSKNSVQGIVCIAQEKVFVTRDRNWYRAPFRLVEIEKLTDLLDGMIDKNNKPEDNYGLLSFIGCLTVKPRNLRSELIREDGLKRT
jgi:hypothetical protein